MTYREAVEMAGNLNGDILSAKVVRILSEDVDPIVKGDEGWDVEFERKEKDDGC